MKASVIITTFNRASFLKKAIQSVLAQTFRDFELIILDNSSSDDTEAVIHAINDQRIVYVKHRPISISEARNLGVAKARAEFLGFLDDDDEWLPEKLELQLDVFSKSLEETALVYGGFLLAYEDGTVYSEYKPVLRGNVFEDYLLGRGKLTGSASNPFMRKSAVLAVGGYSEKIKNSEDWEFYLRLAEKYPFEYVAKPVVKIREHHGVRLGDKLKDAAATELFILNEFSETFKKFPKRRSFFLQSAGGKYCRVGDMKKGRHCFVQAICVYPMNLEVYLQFIFSFFGRSFYTRMHRLYKFSGRGK